MGDAAKAAAPIVLRSKSDRYDIKGSNMEFLEDPEGILTIEQVSSAAYSPKFIQGLKQEAGSNKNLTSTYWTRTTLINHFPENTFAVIELLDFRIDYYEIYVSSPHGGFITSKGGAGLPFAEKNYSHKNFIFNLPIPTGDTCVVYYKIKASKPVSTIASVRTTEKEIQYSNAEYFILALFYGIIVAMALYNIFLFFALVDITYVLYVLYIISIAFFSLSQDGIGFQYIWYNHPGLNDLIFPVSNYFMIVWALLYGRNFLNTRLLLPRWDRGIFVMLALKTGYSLLWFVNPAISYTLWMDIVPLGYLYLCGIRSWTKGYHTARFYVAAFSLFFAGFCTSVLQKFGFVTPNMYTIYSINVGIFLETIMLALALADRIKMLQTEKDKAQRQVIFQYEEQELMKDKLNKELDVKVKERTFELNERTKELEEKSKELDNYLYRSSHDIKGPLKSIIGLTTVGLMDIKDPEATPFFEHILKSSKRLDSVLDHLMMIIKVKEVKVKPVPVNFQDLIAEIITSLENPDDSSGMVFKLQADQPVSFYTDEKLLYSVMQNLIENAIKYRDPSKPSSWLNIAVKVSESSAILTFSDNGIGMDKHIREKIFNSYIRSNKEIPGTGMGLFYTKLSTEKLGGKIGFESEAGTGSTFTVRLKNLVREDGFLPSNELPSK
jgi:signal transduction histidine kinase